MRVKSTFSGHSSDKFNWLALNSPDSGTDVLTEKDEDSLQAIYTKDWNTVFYKLTVQKPETWRNIYDYANQVKLSSESEWLEWVEPTNFSASVVSVSASSPIRVVGDAQTKEISEFDYLYDKKSIAQNNFIELINDSSDTSFEDGVENEYTRGLFNLINMFGKTALQVIGSMIHKGDINEYISSLTLQWLGHINDEDLQSPILRLLMTELKSYLIAIRYGALIGLENLGDERAAMHVSDIASEEQNSSLRDEMRAVAATLAKS